MKGSTEKVSHLVSHSDDVFFVQSVREMSTINLTMSNYLDSRKLSDLSLEEIEFLYNLIHSQMLHSDSLCGKLNLILTKFDD